MLPSSLCVTARRMSVSAMPACSSVEGCAAFPARVRKSSLSCNWRSFSPSVSIRVMSLASPARLSATVEPTCPAPSIKIFTLFPLLHGHGAPFMYGRNALRPYRAYPFFPLFEQFFIARRDHRTLPDVAPGEIIAFDTTGIAARLRQDQRTGRIIPELLSAMQIHVVAARGGVAPVQRARAEIALRGIRRIGRQLRDQFLFEPLHIHTGQGLRRFAPPPPAGPCFAIKERAALALGGKHLGGHRSL